MRPPSMRFPRSLRRGLLAILALPFLLTACGDSLGPGSDVFFPTISAADVAQYCIRRQVAPPTTVSGSIATTDCQEGGQSGDGYNDTFHVRVPNTGAVTFTVDSNFDSWLDLVRVNDVGDIAGTSTLLDSDDDSAPGLDAEITYVLSPNTDYFVLVSGFDDTETGSYTLRLAY